MLIRKRLIPTDKKHIYRPLDVGDYFFVSPLILEALNPDNQPDDKVLEVLKTSPLYNTLLEKQKETIIKACKKETYAIFNDIGTGKTRCAIEIASYKLKQQMIKRVLIFCPLSLFSVWINELKLYNIEPVVIHGKERKQNLEYWKRNSIWGLTNYDSLLNTEFENYVDNETMLIFDESTKIKNPKAKRTKKALVLSLKTTHKLILTGSPFTNNYLEIWSQFFIVDKEAFNIPCNYKKPWTGFYRFRKRFFQPDYMGWKWEPQEGVEEFIKNFISIRSVRFKREEFVDLPEKRYIPIFLPFTPQQKKIYKDMAEKLIAEIQTEKGTTVIDVNTGLAKAMKLHQICGGFIYDDEGNFYKIPTMKIDAVKDIIEGTDESIIIWTRFKAEVEMLRSELLKDYNPAILIGETKNREEELKRFKSGGTRILLGTAETGGYGLTLTEASIMIYYSLTTKGEAIYQSEGRIYRLGTKKPPIYYYLVIGGSIDKFIYNLIMKKKQLIEIDIKKAIEGEE